jgi:hypothetical protein
VKVLLLGVLFLAIGTIDASPRTQLDELLVRPPQVENAAILSNQMIWRHHLV